MKKTHTHKYRRVWLDKAKTIPVWRCQFPDCSHFLRKEFLVGRRAICWQCGEEFVIKSYNTQQVKPTCCTRTKVAKDMTSIQKFLDTVIVHD